MDHLTTELDVISKMDTKQTFTHQEMAKELNQKYKTKMFNAKVQTHKSIVN